MKKSIHVAICCMSILALTGRTAAAGDSGGQWILVTPPVFRPVLAPLIEHRQKEGFHVVIIETAENQDRGYREGDGAVLQARLNRLVREHEGRSYVLLAGVPAPYGRTNAEGTIVPSLPGAVGRMKSHLSDTGYGFSGLDGMPAVAVGRFPARNAEELKAMVEKTLLFDQEFSTAAWRNRLLLLLGNPGGGMLAEMFVQQALDRDLKLLYPSWDARIMLNVASSRYYLPSPLDRQTALKDLQGGALFSIYLGHSNAEGMGLDGWFITRDAWAKLNIAQGAGPFFTCGCFACQMAGPGGEGYGVAAMRNPNGPVAVIGASGESYSAPGQLAAEGLLTCLARPPFPSRLADYWLAVQAGLARGKMDDGTFTLLDLADGSGGKVPLATQRLEHLEMWTLLGDPALRVPVVPVDISIQVPEPLVSGKILTVRGVLPTRLDHATVRLSLERPIDSTPLDLEPVPSISTNRQARSRIYLANHQRANSFSLAGANAQVSGTEFVASLNVPTNLPWASLVLRASASMSNEMGFGILTVPLMERRRDSQ